ncbi:unnamed protein product [Parascedosporium putredinis]|uniref:BHLH domain-containing protein n=1 Tax=Parascedosporium putredinis TaxID=1442378 RepID=A0A9P1GY91_9PEZI|nr:unnamed protein product [Parascedosporium putredinis]CAI7990466.1 unnamed protein product [Parascedosporium putredinis]
MESTHPQTQVCHLAVNAFNENQDVFPEPPPSPPPGDPILTAEDTISLQNFLENLSSDRFNTPCYGEGLNFTDTWLDLPPQLVGSTTSLGQHPSIPSPIQQAAHMQNHNHHMLGDGSLHASSATGMMAPPPPPPAHTSSHHHHSHPGLHLDATPDVVAAAALLPRNGLMSPNNFHSLPLHMSQFPSMSDLSHGFSRLEPGAAIGHSLLPAGFDDTSNAEHQFASTAYTTQPSPPQGPLGGAQQASEIQWGSDASFNQPQGFVPHSHRETHESLVQRKLQMMQCLSVNRSAATTRPSSPTHDHGSPSAAQHLSANSNEEDEEEMNGEGPPRKRRKSRIAKEDDPADDDDEAGRPEADDEKRDSSTGEGPGLGKAGGKKGTPSKRRKSANGAKAPRENLTDQQKRENHIKSEQRRRTVIKEGFDELCIVVPNLQGSGISKSNILTAAAEWLEDLSRFNKELHDQLARIAI